MMWIKKHWDSDYIKMAKEKIREMVSFFISRINMSPLIPYCLKLYKYHEKASTKNSEEESLVQHGPFPEDQGNTQTLGMQLGYMLLAAKYGVPYDMDISRSDKNT
jgi:hypothetical protein